MSVSGLPPLRIVDGKPSRGGIDAGSETRKKATVQAVALFTGLKAQEWTAEAAVASRVRRHI